MFARLKASRGATILGELLMLVAGINIALWFEGKFEDFKDAETEQQYLQGLHDDLTEDLATLGGLVERNKGKIERLREIYGNLPELGEASSGVQEAAMFEPSGYDFFRPSDFTYRSMQESGDFRLLSDHELKKGILKLARQYRILDLLQQNFIQALDDSYIPLMMSSFDLAAMRLSDTDVLEQQVFRNFFAYAIQDTGNRVRGYEAAKEQVALLLARIEAQLD